MASEDKINQFDSLNSFIHKRLTAIAGEIFQVVSDTLIAFQEEIDRSKQANVYLKKMLSDVSNVGLDATNKQTDGSPLEHQDSDQGPLDSDSETSVIHVKLELSSVQEEPETQQQLCTASTCDSVLATTDQRPPRVFTDATNKQTDGSPLEHQDFDQGPLDSDSETSVIQVHLSSVQEEPEIEQQLCTASTCDSALATTDQRPPHVFTGKTDDFEGKGDIKMCMDSYATVKLERCDALICIDKSQLSEIQNGSGDDHLGVIQDECSLQPPSHSNNSSDVSHPAFNLENLATEVLIYCEICGKYFRNDKLLKKHVLTNHKKKSHHCELCGKCFSFPYKLRRHLKTHTGEEPHQCKFCGKMFANRGYVKDHERIHTRERPHSCSICGKRFVKMYLVTLHIQNCHKKTSDAKNHDKSKKTKQNAQGAYCCNLCGKSFDRKHTLNVHYRVHTGEKPYHCRFCDKAFRQKSHVMYHESTHAGQMI